MHIQQFKDTNQARQKSEEPESHQDSVQNAKSPPSKATVAEQSKKTQNVALASLANEISSYLFKYLAGFRIPTHFTDGVSNPEMLAKQLVMIPLVVRVHNVAAGDLAKRFGMKDGSELTVPIIEHYYKNPDLGNPMANEFHMYSLGIATPDQLRTINRIASKTNVVLRSFFDRRELKLLTIDLEFGIAGNQVMIGAEISPRSCRFAEMLKRDRGQKDVFASGSEERIETYTEIRNRIYRTF